MSCLHRFEIFAKELSGDDAFFCYRCPECNLHVTESVSLKKLLAVNITRPSGW